MPAAARAVLEPARDEAAGRNLLIQHDVQNLSRRLSEEGVAHRIVKGAALLRWLPHPGDRWMVDGDVLFARQARHQVGLGLSRFGLRYRHGIRHDGAPTRPERDGPCIEVLGVDGAPIELHFTARPLPAAEPDGVRVTVAGLAVGLSNHVLHHSATSRHLLLRHIGDLRILLDAGHLDVLAEAARRSRTLFASLSWMSALGARDLRDVFAPRALVVRNPHWFRVTTLARRAHALAMDGLLLRALFPTAAYLAAHPRAGAAHRRRHLLRWTSLLRG